LKLSPEQVTLLDKKYKVFLEMALYRRQEKQITRNRQRLSKLSLQFGENILAETNALKCI
jgi:peptidyl-dipeptidase Dcp